MVAFANIDVAYGAIETIHWKCADRGLSLATQHSINSLIGDRTMIFYAYAVALLCVWLAVS